MAVAKVTLNGVTLMDTTDATADANKILNTYTAYIADGSKATGTSTAITPTGTKNISIAQNSTTTEDVTNYASAQITVNVPSSAPNLQAKTNIAPTTTSQTITADSGFDGLSSVQINAMPTGTAGTPTAAKGTVSNHSVSVTPSVTNTTGWITGGTKTGTAVTVTASELASGNKAIVDNGTNIDVVGYSTVSVAVPFSTIYTGTTDPSSSQGVNGDIYIKTS